MTTKSSFLITGDWHIHPYQYPSPEVRLKRVCKVLNKLWQNRFFGCSKQIILGDLFETENVTPFIFNKVIRYADGWEKTHLLAGNHDQTEDIAYSPLETLYSAHIGRLVVINKSPERIFEDKELDISIAGIPYQRNKEDFLNHLGAVLNFESKICSSIIICCHQYFDCFFRWEGSDVIDVVEIVKLLKEFPNIHVTFISGHDHVANAKSYKSFNIVHPGIPLSQNFSEAGYEWGALKLFCDASEEHKEWKLERISFNEFKNEIGDFKIVEISEYDDEKLNAIYFEIESNSKDHYYRFDINAGMSPIEVNTIINQLTHYKKEEGYHIQWKASSFTKSNNKAENVKAPKLLDNDTILKKTVEELHPEGGKDYQNKLIKIGKGYVK